MGASDDSPIQKGPYGSKGTTVDGAGAQALELLQMRFGRIPLVNGEIVAWVFLVFFNHYPVSGDFGYD